MLHRTTVKVFLSLAPGEPRLSAADYVHLLKQTFSNRTWGPGQGLCRSAAILTRVKFAKNQASGRIMRSDAPNDEPAAGAGGHCRDRALHGARAWSKTLGNVFSPCWTPVRARENSKKIASAPLLSHRTGTRPTPSRGTDGRHSRLHQDSLRSREREALGVGAAPLADARGRRGEEPLWSLGHRRSRLRRLLSRRRAFRARPLPHHVCRPALDDPPIRRLLHRRGLQRLLSPQSGGRSEGPLDRLRSRHASRLRLGSSSRFRRRWHGRRRD